MTAARRAELEAEVRRLESSLPEGAVSEARFEVGWEARRDRRRLPVSDRDLEGYAAELARMESSLLAHARMTARRAARGLGYAAAPWPGGPVSAG